VVELRIRDASEADIPALIRLYREAGIEDSGFTDDEARAHFAVLRGYPYYRIFAAESNGAIAGTYALIILDSLAKRGARAGVVENVAVLPAHQGAGIGRAMMQHALGECRAAGCYKMTLSSNLKREGAHHFYDSLGFERHGYSFLMKL